jgi:hypothetical protein
VAVAVGLFTTLRLDVNADADDPFGADERSGRGLLHLGESTVGVVNRHPVLACTAAVAVATTWAMRQAEASSIAAALPWGIAEAVTVVAAFVLLGPTLGLRHAQPPARSS